MTSAAARFLERYVTADGRVIRHDQGGDVVSEGQAYAMLIAEIARRPDVLRTIWRWTREHLGRPDGLFASQATAAGAVVDPQPATDADILIAHALLRYTGPDQAALHTAGRSAAEAVLKHESIALTGGAPLPVAGPWAIATGAPTVNPSYLMPGVFEALAHLTDDDRWQRAAERATTMVQQLTDGGRRLPPDWARLSDGLLHPIPYPGGGAGVQYGFDAGRLPIWFATGGGPAARKLAGDWWRNILGHGGRSGPQALALNGDEINPAPSPLHLMAGAAAATAADEPVAACELRSRAARLAVEDPTYYGAAWVALGPALLDGALDPPAAPQRACA